MLDFSWQNGFGTLANKDGNALAQKAADEAVGFDCTKDKLAVVGLKGESPM
jgi:hypothetical protein